MVQFWVYLLRCSDGRYHAGHTDDLERRISQHLQGLGGDFTARRQPVQLVWSELAPTRAEALAFELRIKGWTRAKKEALIAGEWDRVRERAKPPGARASTSLSTNDGGVKGSEPEFEVPTNTPFVLSEVEGRAAGHPVL